MDGTTNPQLIQSGPEFNEAGLAYRYEMPSGPGPYPTVVMVHGRRGSEDVMWVFRKTVPRPWLVVAPRAPLAERNQFSWLAHSQGEWPGIDVYEPAVETLARFLRVLPSLYNADPDRTYLMGFSQGAAVSIATALRRPELVRGIAALVGFAPDAPDEQVNGRLSGLPVFMAVGTKDPTIPLPRSRQTADLLRRAGADLAYHEYDIGHKLAAAGSADLRAWFLARG